MTSLISNTDICPKCRIVLENNDIKVWHDLRAQVRLEDDLDDVVPTGGAVSDSPGVRPSRSQEAGALQPGRGLTVLLHQELPWSLGLDEKSFESEV